VIAFCGEIVPIVGPWLAFCISAPVILATQPHLIIPAGFIFLAVQLLEGWFLSPRIEGGVVDFNPTQTLLLLAIGGGVGGALGMIFAIPAAAIIRQIVLYTDLRLRGFSPEETFAIASARPGRPDSVVDPALRSEASVAAAAVTMESGE
jgi:predicted PurR-regulated permease PerM